MTTETVLGRANWGGRAPGRPKLGEDLGSQAWPWLTERLNATLGTVLGRASLLRGLLPGPLAHRERGPRGAGGQTPCMEAASMEVAGSGHWPWAAPACRVLLTSTRPGPSQPCEVVPPACSKQEVQLRGWCGRDPQDRLGCRGLGPRGTVSGEAPPPFRKSLTTVWTWRVWPHFSALFW